MMTNGLMTGVQEREQGMSDRTKVWCERGDCTHRHSLGYCMLRSLRMRTIPNEPTAYCASYTDEWDADYERTDDDWAKLYMNDLFGDST